MAAIPAIWDDAKNRHRRGCANAQRSADWDLARPQRRGEPLIDDDGDRVVVLFVEVVPGERRDSEHAEVAWTNLVALGEDRPAISGVQTLVGPPALDRPARV